MNEHAEPYRILFFSTYDACRGQIAEGFIHAMRDDRLRVYSAGLETRPLHPFLIESMAEIGIDISNARSKTLDSLEETNFDLVINLSEEAAAACPIFPGNPARVDWNLPDPTSAGESNRNIENIRHVRDKVGRLVNDLFKHGYIDTLVHAKRQADLILNNLSEGILAHDLDRKIFYFNPAAERITGFDRTDVIGRDCHEVFENGFCGENCNFCEKGTPPGFGRNERRIAIVTKDGGIRQVTMSIKTLNDTRNKPVGVLASLKDLTRELELEKRLNVKSEFSGIIGRDPKILDVFDMIRDLARSNASVLIQGESGTGKELVAAAIHREGPRAQKLFVPINCGALPEGLLESELFGHVRGAFTGAIRDKKGRFELADGGTIFLDEIGDISPAMQVKLMRVLQEGTFERVGSEKTIKVDVRVISATNKDLQKSVREDLYYRLCVAPITIPPLRERRGDIPLIANHILKRLLKESERVEMTLSQQAIDMMMAHRWPGNVRELHNWIQFALFKCKDTMILPEHLPPQQHPLTNSSPTVQPLRRRRKRKLIKDVVERALEKTKGNKLAAARELGVSRATLYRFLDEEMI